MGGNSFVSRKQVIGHIPKQIILLANSHTVILQLFSIRTVMHAEWMYGEFRSDGAPVNYPTPKPGEQRLSEGITNAYDETALEPISDLQYNTCCRY